MATVRTSELAKANEKHFVWLLLLFLLLLSLRYAYSMREGPLPFQRQQETRLRPRVATLIIK